MPEKTHRRSCEIAADRRPALMQVSILLLSQYWGSLQHAKSATDDPQVRQNIVGTISPRASIFKTLGSNGSNGTRRNTATMNKVNVNRLRRHLSFDRLSAGLSAPTGDDQDQSVRYLTVSRQFILFEYFSESVLASLANGLG
jgi:hypothetical protein